MPFTSQVATLKRLRHKHQPHPMAPPRNPIWSHYIETKSRERGVRDHPEAKCASCGKELKNAMPSENMLRHLLKCPSLNPETQEYWKQVHDERKRAKAAKALSSFTARSPISVNKRLFASPDSNRKTPKKARRSSPSVRTPRKRITRKNEENFMRVAMAFYSTGIPFRVVEDPFFRALFDYELPSRRQLSGRLLDRVFEREKLQAIEELRGQKNLAVITDGWSNCNGDSIINFVFTNSRITPVFWKSMTTAAEEHTGRYIADSILSVINELEGAVGSGVVTSVVTDNAANMQKAWKYVSEARPGIVCSGCGAHGMNLVMKDMLATDYFADTLSDAKTLTRFCKARIGFWSVFRERQSQMRSTGNKLRRLSMPVPTRWYTQEKCISNVVANKAILAGIFSDDEFLKRYKGNELNEAHRIFKDGEFWLNAAAVLKMMAPINSSLAEFERDDSCSSMIYHRFQSFKSDPAYTKPIHGCPTSVQTDVLEIIDARQKSICTSTLKIANLLDPHLPRYGESSLELINEAATLAVRVKLVPTAKKSAFHTQVQNFATDKANFGKEIEGFTPYNWWCLSGDKRYELVREFAKLMLCIPTSSASSERNWSIHSFIHSKTRNRLSPERVNKLVFVYCNKKGPDSVNHLMYEVHHDACDDHDSSDSSEDESAQRESRRRDWDESESSSFDPEIVAPLSGTPVTRQQTLMRTPQRRNTPSSARTPQRGNTPSSGRW